MDAGHGAGAETGCRKDRALSDWVPIDLTLCPLGNRKYETGEVVIKKEAKEYDDTQDAEGEKEEEVPVGQ